MKMLKSKGFLAAFALAVALSGCSSYSWRPGVPEAFRSVAVPTFRNESKVSELGSAMSTQLLREFQREGTFKIQRAGDAALEIQGVVKEADSRASGYDRRTGLRLASYNMSAKVVISVVDKRNGRVLIDNKVYRPTTTFMAAQDLSTAQRDSSGRLAEDLARQVVDDVVNLNLNKKKVEAGK